MKKVVLSLAPDPPSQDERLEGSATVVLDVIDGFSAHVDQEVDRVKGLYANRDAEPDSEESS